MNINVRAALTTLLICGLVMLYCYGLYIGTAFGLVIAVSPGVAVLFICIRQALR